MMLGSEDAFLRFLRSTSGQTVHFFPGAGGLAGALSSLAFYDLCRGNGIDCLPHADSDEVANGLVVIGAPGATGYAGDEQGKRRFADNRVVLLPRSFSAFEEIEAHLVSHATIFCRDRASVRMAELKGADPRRTLLCRDIAVHLDLSDLEPRRVRGDGTLTLRSGGPRSASEAGGAFADPRREDGDGQWLSADLCRSTVAAAVVLFRPYAEIGTDEPSVAILAAKLGKDVVLHRGPGHVNAAAFEDSIMPVFPAVRLEAASEPASSETMPGHGARAEPGAAGKSETDRLERLLKIAMRETQIAREERDRLFMTAAELRERLDRKVIAEDRSTRGADEAGPRLVTVRHMEQRLSTAEERAEARLADVRAEAEAAVAIAAKDARDAAAMAEQTRQDLEAGLAAAERARGEDANRRAAAATHEAELQGRIAELQGRSARLEGRSARLESRVAELQGRAADLEGALDARTRQALALQTDLDEQTTRCRVAEARINIMRALIDRQAMAGEGTC